MEAAGFELQSADLTLIPKTTNEVDADGARRLLVATRSQHKLRELRELLGVGSEVELVAPDDVGIEGEPDETGLTFETNARIKARAGA